MNLMNNKTYIQYLFKDDDFFYVTTDVKRALGLEDILPNFHVITSVYDPLIPLLRNKNIHVFCLEEEVEKENMSVKSARQLFFHPKAQNYIHNQSSRPNILTFKPVEGMGEEKGEDGYEYIGNGRELNEQFEDKINFYQILKDNFKENMVPSIIGQLAELTYGNIRDQLGESLVIQFGKGWAGNTSFDVENESDFENLKKRFPQTHVRVSKRINGNTFLNNCCIYKNTIFHSSPAIQINGISWLNKNPLATSGREWGNKFLSSKETEEIRFLTEKMGRLLIKSTYRGYFGLDFIVDSVTGKVYVSEINARFTASCPFYTKLELGSEILPLYVYHLAEFLGKDIKKEYRRYEGIEGCEVNGELDKMSNLRVGTYKIEDDGTFDFENDSYDPAKILKDEVVLITDPKNSVKIQTNYPLLASPGKFQEKFEKIIKKEIITG